MSTLALHDAKIRPGGPDFPDRLAQKLLEYSREVADADSPEEVLDRLHAITSKIINLNVGGAARIPQRVMDWDDLRLGKTVFHASNSEKRFWEEWIRQFPHKLPVGLALAWATPGPLTTTEALQMLQPIGADRWGFDLALKWGIRDSLVCNVDGRWLLYFWSSKPIAKSLWKPIKVLVFAAASFAVMRLDQLVGSEPTSKQSRYSLNAARARGPTAIVDRHTVQGRRRKSRPQQRDDQNASAESAAQAWRAKPYSGGRRGHPATFYSLVKARDPKSPRSIHPKLQLPRWKPSRRHIAQACNAITLFGDSSLEPSLPPSGLPYYWHQRTSHCQRG